MNATHVHLILSHLPLTLILLGLFFLLLSIWKKEMVLPGHIILILAGLMVVPLYVSGSPASETMLMRDGVQIEAAIKEHSQAAQFALASTSTVAVIAILSLILRLQGSMHSKKFLIATTLAAIFCSTVLTRTAYLGGMIKHDEIRPNYKTATEP